MSQSVTLRKASKFRNRLEIARQQAASLIEQTNITVNVYDPDALQQITKASETFQTNLAQYTAICATLFSIRSRIGRINAENGVNELLAERSAKLGQLASMTRLANAESMITLDRIRARIDGTLEQIKVNTNRYDTRDTVTVGFATETMIANAKVTEQKLRATLDDIQDTLESINSTKTIELSDTDVAVLTAQRIL